MTKSGNITQAPPPEKLYRVAETAERLNAKPTFVWKLINSGKIASYKIGGRVYVPESAIAEYLSSCYRPARTASHVSRGMSAIQKSAKRKATEVA